MRTKRLSTFLLFALFGVTLGFFGMLYEGVTLIAQMLTHDMARLKFWQDFYSYINPIFFYIPMVPIATLILVFLYFKTTPSANIKRELGLAILFQLVALALTFYIVTRINLKFYLIDIEKNFDVISDKTKLVNVISIIRLIFAAMAMRFTLMCYINIKKVF